MPECSIASLIKRCLGARSSNMRRFILVGSLMTSTFEASFPASAHSSVTQVLQGDSYLHLNVITKIQLAPHNSLVKCTLESGGGWCRYVKISLHIVYYLQAFSNPTSRTDQARQLYPSSYHLTRPNSHIFGLKVHTPSTCPLEIFLKISILNLLSGHKCY